MTCTEKSQGHAQDSSIPSVGQRDRQRDAEERVKGVALLLAMRACQGGPGTNMENRAQLHLTSLGMYKPPNPMFINSRSNRKPWKHFVFGEGWSDGTGIEPVSTGVQAGKTADKSPFSFSKIPFSFRINLHFTMALCLRPGLRFLFCKGKVGKYWEESPAITILTAVQAQGIKEHWWFSYSRPIALRLEGSLPRK